MTLKDFKQALIDFGREQIPEQLESFIRIPGSAEGNGIYLTNTKGRETIAQVRKHFGQESIRTNISSNVDITELKNIEAFKFDKQRNDELIEKVFPNRDVEELLQREKENLAHNIAQALAEKRTSVFRFVEELKKNGLPIKFDKTNDKLRREQIWVDFLRTWPIRRVREMTLQEYTNLNKSDSFCYWLESLTQDLGSIWGGSSYKFGIYHKKDLSADLRPGYVNDGIYGWVSKYGNTSEDAFISIRTNIIKIIQYSEDDKLEDIDKIDLGPAYKWKIAGLYHKNIPLVFDPKIVTFLARTKGQVQVREGDYSKMYRFLASLKPKGMSILDYSGQLWKLYEDENDVEKLSEISMPMETIVPLNQILYGPPGTGKTYLTIARAIQIVDPEFYWNNLSSRKNIRERFKQLLISDWLDPNGQIAFCTFHQSFSYEDFIEGIKPVEPSPNDKYLKYQIEDGLFKRLVLRASADENKREEASSIMNLTKEEFDKVDFYKISLGDINNSDDDEIYQYCIKNNCIAIGWGENTDFSGLSDADVIKTVDEKKLQPYTANAINNFKNYLRIGYYVLVSNGNYSIRAIGKVIGDYKFSTESGIGYNHFRQVSWIMKNVSIPVESFYGKLFSQQTIYKLNKDLVKAEFFEKSSISKSTVVNAGKKRNYVLIIDEINRGNISQIFGELITLLEEDKRLGQDESLELTLPYSKRKFGVPSNLYIIGTMNTADRGVEAIDTALRRRFKFEELPANPEKLKDIPLIKGINVADLLTIINKRIEKLLDRDHQIGHAYFIRVQDEFDLRAVFNRGIIPLLQEYFYGDIAKIGLVLGEKFVVKNSLQGNFNFAKFGHESESEFRDRPTYIFEGYEQDIEGFIEAVKSVF
jgi:5-methylcytosine-specific restriction enzyme B